MSSRGATRRSWSRRRPNLLKLARYLVLNPARAHMVASAGDYAWSSYRAMTRGHAPPDWLERRAILAMFGQTEGQGMASYRNFVAAGTGEPSPWENLKRQVSLGTDTFVESCSRGSLRDRTYARCLRQGADRSRARCMTMPRRTRSEMKRSRRATPAAGTGCRRSVTTLAHTCHVSAGLSADNPGMATRPRQRAMPDHWVHRSLPMGRSMHKAYVESAHGERPAPRSLTPGPHSKRRERSERRFWRSPGGTR